MNDINNSNTDITLSQNDEANKNTENSSPSINNYKQKKGISAVAVVAICIICCIITSIASTIITLNLTSDDSKSFRPNESANETLSSNAGNDTAAGLNNTLHGNTSSNTISGNSDISPATYVATKVSPSIVGIKVTTLESSGFWGSEYESSSEGSGVIYTADGYVITNYHVISEMLTSSGDKNKKSKLYVYLNQDSSKEYSAEVIGYDQASDLAVIKIDEKNLTPIEIGNSDELIVGDIAIAIGNPGGLDFMGSITQGIISGLDRNLQTDNSFEDLKLIQTDAAINPGNSGGALCNSNGQLIGINSVKLVETGYESMGFAIPSNDVVKICNNIINNNSGQNVYLGLEFDVERFTAEKLESMGYPGGIIVNEIASNSPAYYAGFELYDILTVFNGKEIRSVNDLIEAKKQCSAGDTVTATVYRETDTGTFFSPHITREYINLEITFK